MDKSDETTSLVEATIDQLQSALESKVITCVELVALYLRRIATYDCNGPSLNSICVLNPNVLEEAERSDAYRASMQPSRPLEGIPFTVKDSFCAKGMTVAAGSPAFADLIASKDAEVVSFLRQAGAVLLGKTNMPPMADGGCQRGVYGRAESPYNAEYLTAAFASGSSNGSGTAIASSFAAFGIAGETVSSGRSPASNNALVGYSPSRGIISMSGQWPLYPTCDVVVPHVRTIGDLLKVLDVLVATSPSNTGDFWREQKFIPIPEIATLRPSSYSGLAQLSALQGRRIGLPRCYTGIGTNSAILSDDVSALWNRAKKDLEALGATLIETDFPLVENYERQSFIGQSCNIPGVSDTWLEIERRDMITLAWDDFLRANHDEQIPDLTKVDAKKIHPWVAPMDDHTKYTPAQNHVRYQDMIDIAKNRSGSISDLPGCETALKALEDARKRDLESWLDLNNFDLLAFPTNGDLARADAEDYASSMFEALRPGVKYSNGGRALKHFGVPAITVPMGTTKDKSMPVGLTFAGKAYSDSDLLQCAYAYEQATKRRQSPWRTPVLLTDEIRTTNPHRSSKIVTVSNGTIATNMVLKFETRLKIVKLETKVQEHNVFEVTAYGSVYSEALSCNADAVLSITCDINGDRFEIDPANAASWSIKTRVAKNNPSLCRYPTARPVPRDQIMCVAVAKLANGKAIGSFVLLDNTSPSSDHNITP